MNDDPIVMALEDMMRISIALHGDNSKPEMIRKLHGAGLRPSRIASLLSMKLSAVTSVIAKTKAKGGS